MRARTARWVAGGTAAVSVALMADGLALAYADRHLVPAGLTSWDLSDVVGQVSNIAVPVIAFIVASRRPANRIGWLALAAGLALGLNRFASSYSLRALVAAPGSLPAGRAAAWLANWTWVIPLAAIAFVFLLFPTGRLRSRRWRVAAWFVGGVLALTAAGALVSATRVWSRPFTSHAPSFGRIPVTVATLEWFGSCDGARSAGSGTTDC